MNLDVLYHYMNSTHFLEKVQLHDSICVDFS